MSMLLNLYCCFFVAMFVYDYFFFLLYRWPAIVDVDPDYDIYCELESEESVVPVNGFSLYLCWSNSISLSCCLFQQ